MPTWLAVAILIGYLALALKLLSRRAKHKNIDFDS